MIEHLRTLIISAVFNPAFLAFLIVAYVLGRILGGFMPWDQVVKPMLILFLLGLVVKFTVWRAGYDLYFLFGFPFMAGLWTGSRKHQR